MNNIIGRTVYFANLYYPKNSKVSKYGKFKGKIIDSISHKYYYLIKMDKKSYDKWMKNPMNLESGYEISGPIFSVYFESLLDIVEENENLESLINKD